MGLLCKRGGSEFSEYHLLLVFIKVTKAQVADHKGVVSLIHKSLNCGNLSVMKLLKQNVDCSDVDERVVHSSDERMDRTEWQGERTAGKKVVLSMARAVCWFLLFFPSAAMLFEAIRGHGVLMPIPKPSILLGAVVGLAGLLFFNRLSPPQEKKLNCRALASLIGEAMSWFLILFPSSVVCVELYKYPRFPEETPGSWLLLSGILGLAGVVYFSAQRDNRQIKDLRLRIEDLHQQVKNLHQPLEQLEEKAEVPFKLAQHVSQLMIERAEKRRTGKVR